ncbi:MAG: T9SS type A sorting domain-containing protein [Bacteroidota bacterium]|nr:T9SS type A sorting domain-containing protein [Bacteroidota bacterium]
MGLCGFADLFAQQNTDASGGNAYGTGGSASFSIGQVDYITASDSSGNTTQGLQQSYEILIIKGIEEIDINLTLYPNPAADFVVLSVWDSNIQNMTYLLYDMQGKLIENKKLNSNQTSISMADLANDIYFIKVLDNDSELKVFKIIKNK